MRRNGGRVGDLGRLAAWLLLGVLAISCSTYRAMSVAEKREFLADLERDTLAELVQEHPEAQSDMDISVGYAVFSNSMTKVPFVGAGEGIGVVVDTTTGKRAYLKVGRLDVGGGLGVRKYRVVIFFFDTETLEDLADGELRLGGSAEAGAGHQEVGTDTGGDAASRKDDYVYYVLSDEGVSATITVRATQYSVLDLGE